MVLRHRPSGLTSSSLTYATASGSLFPATPSNNDEYQGELGDCYFISSLGTIADTQSGGHREHVHQQRRRHVHRPLLRRHVRGFYNANGTVSDGFANNAGTADYVTVNCSLPTYSNGMLVYADYGSNASSPSQLALDPAGREGLRRSGTRPATKAATARIPTPASRAAGWPRWTPRCLGHNATDYSVARLDRAGDDQCPGRERGGDHRHRRQ